VEVPQDIVTIASSDSELTSLVSALVEAGLVGALDTAGPFTVLAPTNAAFDALGDVSLNVHELRNVLLYHVIPGSVLAETVVTLDSAITLNGQSVPIRVENDNVFIGDAQVIVTDIEASNGVIHKIDAVLIPEMDEECPYFEFICDFLDWLYII
jgi:transforming growth factor-beta-induced protein